jgi:hypothetical protein
MLFDMQCVALAFTCSRCLFDCDSSSAVSLRCKGHYLGAGELNLRQTLWAFAWSTESVSLMQNQKHLDDIILGFFVCPSLGFYGQQLLWPGV